MALEVLVEIFVRFFYFILKFTKRMIIFDFIFMFFSLDVIFALIDSNQKFAIKLIDDDHLILFFSFDNLGVVFFEKSLNFKKQLFILFDVLNLVLNVVYSELVVRIFKKGVRLFTQTFYKGLFQI